jgi:hypothetical protein
MKCSKSKLGLATVIVGEEKKGFAVHEVLLTHYSDFFRAALNGKFKEAEEKRITLHDEEPVVFESFVHWLYHSNFPTQVRDEHGKPIEEWTANLRPRIDLYIHLFILSDKLSIKELDKIALDMAFNAFRDDAGRSLLRSSTIHKAFDCLKPDSKMCHLIGRGCAFWGTKEQLETLGYFDCVPFVANLACSLLDTYKHYKPPNQTLCSLHEHTIDKESGSSGACLGANGIWNRKSR